MDLWANTVATLSLLIAIAAFWWAVKTFGKTKTHLAIELEIRPPVSFKHMFGSVGLVIMRIIESKSPEVIAAFSKFREESFPVLRDELPKLVSESPILQEIWPSIATWFSKSPLLVVSVRNEGISDSSVLVVEVGKDSSWIEPDGRAIYFKFTDTMPVTVVAGGDAEIWFPVDKVKAALEKINVEWKDAQVRVIASNKSKFSAKLSSVAELKGDIQ